MALASSHCSCSLTSQLLPTPRSKSKSPPFFASAAPLSSSKIFPSGFRLWPAKHICSAAKSNPSASSTAGQGRAPNQKSGDKSKSKEEEEEVEEVEVEEDLPWIQEKALDVVEFTGSVTQAIPGPRVGSSSLPWILALPLAYAGITFVIAFVKTVRKLTSPRAKRKRLV